MTHFKRKKAELVIPTMIGAVIFTQSIGFSLNLTDNFFDLHNRVLSEQLDF